MQRFKNKVVVITGGASGIGRETAIQFGVEGAYVVIADINADLSYLTIKEIEQLGGAAHFINTDVSLADECKQLIEKTENQLGKIDILFNNAGIEISGPLTNFSEIDFDRLIATNLKSVFLCSQFALKKMIQRRQGVIINTASVASFLAWPGDAVYSASKAGVMLLTKAMALECALYSIRINAVAPGVIDTPMTERALSHYSDIKKAKEEKGQIHPMGRLGIPSEVAKTVLFLSSDDASFITGVTLPVDGGYLAG
jgi:dihydroanticapsin dehydrogenase